MADSAFYYVDGVPTKGIWVDLEVTDTTDEVLEQLAAAGYVPTNEDGEPEYGGDLLVADIEGDLVRAFYSSSTDTLDLTGYVEVRDYCDANHVVYDAAAAYISNRGGWDENDFGDAFCGEYQSEQAYAEELFDEVYLHEVPDGVKPYIDYEKFARDLFLGDYTYVNGYVFRNT